jgi:hypothetical protein
MRYLQIAGIGCSLLLAAAVLYFPWHPAPWNPPPSSHPQTLLGGGVVSYGLGGGVSYGRGLWGVGVRLPWIASLLSIGAIAFVASTLVRRSKMASAVLALAGAGGLAVVLAVGPSGQGLVGASIAVIGILLIGVTSLLVLAVSA